MSSFDDLYFSNIRTSIHYLYRGGRPLRYELTRVSKMFMYKHDDSVIAMLIRVTKNPTPREIKRRAVVPLQEILHEIPTTLKGETISWLIVEGEEDPSCLIIHKELTTEELTRLGQQALLSEIFEKAFKNPLNFSYTRTVRERAHEAFEQAKTSKLAHSEPVATYIK